MAIPPVWKRIRYKKYSPDQDVMNLLQVLSVGFPARSA
jgi:hypothetical protein